MATQTDHPWTLALRAAKEEKRKIITADHTAGRNLASAAFLVDDLLVRLHRAISYAGLEPRWLDLDITEETLVADSDRARDVMAELREAGFTISVDDFGRRFR